MQATSALQQALNSIRGAQQKLSTQLSGKGTELVNNIANKARKTTDSFARKANSNPVPQDRISRNANPIATTTTGAELYDDGSIKQTPTSTYLNRLKDNVFRQYAFTPQAEKYLRSIPLGYTADETANGVFSNYGFLEAQGEGPGGILINPNVQQEHPATAATALTHEFLHGLDDNLLQSDIEISGYNPLSQGKPYSQRYDPKITNSRKFFEVLSQMKGEGYKSIEDFLKLYPEGYGDGAKYDWKDSEGFAEFGARQGQNALLSDVGGAYKGIFQPMSKQQNMSYANPTLPTFIAQDEMVKNIRKPNRIRNKIRDPKKLTSIRLEEDY